MEVEKSGKQEINTPVAQPIASVPAVVQTTSAKGKKTTKGKNGKEQPSPKPSTPAPAPDAQTSQPDTRGDTKKQCRFAADHSKCKYGDKCMFYQPVENGKSEEQLPIVDVRDLIVTFKLRVAPNPSVEKFLKSKNVPYETGPKSSWNGHPLSHVARDIAFLEVLRTVGVKRKTLSVLDWFGSDRNQKLCSILGKRASDVKLTITAAPDQIYQGDTARATKSRVPLLDSDKFDIAIVQDVYSYGPDAKSPMTPDAVKKILKYTHLGEVYFIVRFFNGDAGWDDVEEGEVPEMVWYREKGLIFASPEREMSAYPGHPDVNWLQLRHVDGVDISPLFQCGPYQVIRCTLAAPDAKALAEQKLPEGKIQRKLLARWWVIPRVVSDWWNKSWLSYIGELPAYVEYLVNMKSYGELAPKFTTRMPFGQAMDACFTATRESMKEPGIKELWRRFPKLENELVTGTCMAALYLGRNEVANEVSTLRESNITAEETLKNARATDFVTPASFTALRWLLLGICVSLLGVRMARRLRLTSGDLGKGIDLNDPALNRVKWLDCLVGAPVLEEVIKFICPPLGYAMVYFEYILNTFNISRSIGSFNPFAAFPALIMHHITLGLQARSRTLRMLFYSVLIHGSFNGFVLAYSQLYSKERKQAYEDFKFLYEQGKKVEVRKTLHQVLPATEKLPALQSIPGKVEILRGKMSVWLKGVKVPPGAAIDALKDETVNPAYIYAILITNGLLWRPQKSGVNLLVSLITRVHADPFKLAPPKEERHVLWENLAKDVVKSGLIGGSIEDLPSIEFCAAAMGSKGKRIIQSDHRDHMGDNLKWPKKQMVKSDETIPANKNVGGELSLKPRSIVDLDAKYHSRTTQWSRALADHFHLLWNEKQIYTWRGYPIRIVFCSGYNGHRLTGLADMMQDPTTVGVLVCGDDAYINLGPLARRGIRFIEGDLTMCDQSEDEGPLLHSTRVWGKALGVPQEFWDLILDSCGKPYVCFLGDLKIQGESEMQLATGSTMTTLLNSISNAFLWLHIVANHFDDPPRRALELGFTLKLRSHGELWQGTFLKGWWLPDPRGDFNWIVLPSLVAKIGKIMNDPVSITKVTRQGKEFRFPPERAVRIVAFGIALSYGEIPKDYPILGPFLVTLSRLGEWHSLLDARKILSENHDFKAMSSVSSLDRKFALMAISERYNLSIEDLCRVEDELGRIAALPAYIQDPVFQRLVEMDYE